MDLFEEREKAELTWDQSELDPEEMVDDDCHIVDVVEVFEVDEKEMLGEIEMKKSHVEKGVAVAVVEKVGSFVASDRAFDLSLEEAHKNVAAHPSIFGFQNFHVLLHLYLYAHVFQTSFFDVEYEEDAAAAAAAVAAADYDSLHEPLDILVPW